MAAAASIRGTNGETAQVYYRASQRVTGVERVVDVIGGLHLLDPPQERLEATVSYFDQLALQKLHACHCTDLRSRIALARCAPLQEVGSGLVLECE
jgi:7,8-dihydropterin-6-yl-methyl-4-(beta-D-ribofuranosyl)aminobenzene 5'-phosphate synthase